MFSFKILKPLLLFSIALSMSVFDCFADEEGNWKIGGKIHFEEGSGSDYMGIVEINQLTREALKSCFEVKSDTCARNAKPLIKKEKGDYILTHYEERSKPGIGEEMHATLLYTSKRVDNGHETLRDVCANLAEVDETLSCEKAPTVDQVAKAYQKIISPDWKFEISNVEFIQGKTGSAIVAKLHFEGREEILNKKGHPVSGSFLHMTLVNVDPTVSSEREKIDCVVSILKKKLTGKMIKVANKNGQADLEFGLSGSSLRVRP